MPRRLAWFAGLVAAVLIIARLMGLSPIGSGESVEDIDRATNRYAQFLADGDLDSVGGMVGLTVNARQNGVTVAEAVAGEALCLDWSRAQVMAITSPVTPFHAQVVYFDGNVELLRIFGHEEGSWSVTLDHPPCTSGVG